MCNYTVQELADMSGESKRTFERRLMELRHNMKFRKKSIGRRYNTDEALQISELLMFTFIPKSSPPNTAKHRHSPPDTAIQKINWK